MGEVSTPVRTKLGYYLVRVSAAEPLPADSVLLDRMRTDLARELRDRLLADARIQLIRR